MSKNASRPLIGVEPIEPEVDRQAATVLAQPCRQFARVGLPRDPERPLAMHVDVDVVAGLQVQRA